MTEARKNTIRALEAKIAVLEVMKEAATLEQLLAINTVIALNRALLALEWNTYYAIEANNEEVPTSYFDDIFGAETQEEYESENAASADKYYNVHLEQMNEFNSLKAEYVDRFEAVAAFYNDLI